MIKHVYVFMLVLMGLFMGGCGGSSNGGNTSVLVVDSLEDLETPPEGTVTLRSALNAARSGQAITFDESLDGATIELSVVGEEHSILKGEVMGMREEPSGMVSYLVGYFERDYGTSALYARKNVVIDASGLPSGITLQWTGGDANPARVLAVYGNLTLANVSITGGKSVARDIATDDPTDQPWTLARGGAVAVWGIAKIINCTLYDNHCEGDFDSSRDRGAFGGGLYADIVEMTNCVVSGNSVYGLGAAGGGVYSVGGAESTQAYSEISHSSICGNLLTAAITYGGGVYSDGGSIGKRKTLRLINTTISRNLVQALPGTIFPLSIQGRVGYWRGGGVYMSNGFLFMHSCTVVENQVHGVPRTDSLGKSNLAGGIAATIGNAHGVEDMRIGHSIITGNTVTEIGGSVYAHDIFTGSLMYFRSMGYNCLGALDFSQILVPVGEPNWASLCRKHFPKQGDMNGVNMADVLDLTNGITVSHSILSMGVDAGEPVPLYYSPAGVAVDRIPQNPYAVEEIFAEYLIRSGENNFLSIFLDRVEEGYDLPGFAELFTADFEDFLQNVDLDPDTPENVPYTNPSGVPILTLADTQWFGPAETWPKELHNYPYIHFWHQLDAALLNEGISGMGPEGIGDQGWKDLFSSGNLVENPNIRMTVSADTSLSVSMQSTDQRRAARPVNSLGDIGAIEGP